MKTLILFAIRNIKRLGKFIYYVGIKTENLVEVSNSLVKTKQITEIRTRGEDHVEGLPTEAPSFKIESLSERVVGKSMASIRSEAIQLLFSLHAGHVIASEILISRKIEHLTKHNRSIKSKFKEELEQINQFITNWSTDAGSLDAAISLIRNIELPDAPLLDVIEPTAEELDLGRYLLEKYEQNFNQQLLDHTLSQEN